MRIDYFIVSEKLKDRIVACEMHGQGIELQGVTQNDTETLLFLIYIFFNLEHKMASLLYFYCWKLKLVPEDNSKKIVMD